MGHAELVPAKLVPVLQFSGPSKNLEEPAKNVPRPLSENARDAIKNGFHPNHLMHKSGST